MVQCTLCVKNHPISNRGMKMGTVRYKLYLSLAIMSVSLAVLLMMFQNVLAARNVQDIDSPLATPTQEASAFTSLARASATPTSTPTLHLPQTQDGSPDQR
jgi:hypothetical protein